MAVPSPDCPAGRLHAFAAALSESNAFVVLSGAAAVLAAGLNLTQALVIMCLAWRSWKCAYHLALSLCGLLSAVTLLWHAVALRLPDAGCGAAPSALSVALLVGYVAHVTAPVVHRCVADTWPGAFAGHARNRALCALLSGFAWCETVLLAVTVLSDWPSGAPQPAAAGGSSAPADPCSLPHRWSSAFSTFVCALYTLHVVVDLAVLIDITAADSKRRARGTPQPLPTIAAATESCRREAIGEDEDDFFGEGPARNRVDLATLWGKFLLLLLGTLPLIVIMFQHMVVLAPAPSSGSPPCPTFRDTLPVWTLLCTVLLGVTMPLVNVYADPIVSAGSLYLIRGLCCSLRRRRRVTPIRHA